MYLVEVAAQTTLPRDATVCPHGFSTTYLQSERDLSSSGMYIQRQTAYQHVRRGYIPARRRTLYAAPHGSKRRVHCVYRLFGE